MNRSNFARPNFTRLATATLLGGASILSMTSAAQAARVLFESNVALDAAALQPGREVTLENGTTQIQLDGGAIASFVGAAQFSLRDDGSIDLRRGSVTVVNSAGTASAVHLPGGVQGAVQGQGSAGSFTAAATGSRGSAMSGVVVITGNGTSLRFTTGQFWTALAGHAPDRVIANAASAVPVAGPVRPMLTGRVVAAAENGIPVALGEGLAGVGASGDVVAAARRIEAFNANSSLTTFPGGDYALLTAYAARAASPFGGPAFRGAGADIVLTYFQYLAQGGQRADFRTAYAAILVNYLNVVRSGALPSGFSGATQAQLSAYIAFIGRTDGFGALSNANRQLLDAYLAFLQGGGTPDRFGPNATALVTAYLDFLRAGGDPAAFQQASGSVVAQYLAIVGSGGLRGQLSVQNRAFLDAYLANGVGFTQSYAVTLSAFVVYLNGGGLPSAYTGASAATIRAYLETLQSTGLFESVLGNQATFLAGYLSYLQGGGTPDTFDRLPINIQIGQAAALNAFAAYLNGGGVPSAYGALSDAQIRAYIAALQTSGRLGTLTGVNADLFSGYYAYLIGGGAVDGYSGLPINVLTGQATALNAFFAYVQAGGVPSAYGTLNAQQIQAYLAALQDAGFFNSLLGVNATFFADYYTYLIAGGNLDGYAGLPNVDLGAYASALTAFVAYLNAGGLPSGYGALSAEQIRTYLIALQTSGRLGELLGGNAALLGSYLEFLRSGGAPDTFTGLPIVTYNGYASALTAFVAYLNAGGLPSAYTALSPAQVQAYLAALQANGQLTALLGVNAQFLSAYLVYVQGGGVPDTFGSLPIVTFNGYATALNAYYAYLLGGGLPSRYTALTATQIRTYLEALQSAGQLNALLGANAGLFVSYLDFLRSGGAPDAFGDLPIVTYNGYASALTAFVAYLNAGGLPSAYTALTPAQVQAYLSALQANGQLTALLGVNAQFLTAYLVYVQGGGSPDAFTSLPIVTFNGYATALNAYYAYLVAGGLPSGYTALTQAQIRAYLDALQTSGQFTALLGGNAAFLADYLAYIGRGGAADSYGALPIVTYRGYADALVAYYAFLRGGGVPSAYTALTAAQIRTYLEALSGNGQLTALLGVNASFFSSYLVYVQGGGSPDAYPSLPPAVVTPISTAGVFVPIAQSSSYRSTVAGSDAFNYAVNENASGQASFTPDGLPTLIGAGITRGSAVTREAGGDSYMSIGRWTEGTVTRAGYGRTLDANHGFHYLVAAPSVTLPTGGVVDYSIFAKTQPTWVRADLPPGLFDAQMRVAFGATPRAAILGRLVMPEVGGPITYNFGEQYVYDDVARNGFGVSLTSFGGLTESLHGTGNACAGGNNCYITFSGYAAGPNAARIGFTYATSTGSSGGPAIEGAVIFGQNGSFNPPSDTGPAQADLDRYATALSAFVAFVNTRGIPSQYGALSITQLRAYYAALTQAGQLNHVASQADLDFLTLYIAYLNTGALADAYAALPSNANPIPAPVYSYTAGLPTSGLRQSTVFRDTDGRIVTGSIRNTGITLTGGTVDRVGDAGQPSWYYLRNAARQAELWGDARVIVGRWSDGTMNAAGHDVPLSASQGFHFLEMAPQTFNLPYVGRVDYTLLGATRPTFAGGESQPGVFDARMSVLLSSNPLVAMAGTIRMPESGGITTYSFTTPGGLTDLSRASSLGYDAKAQTFGFSAALSGNGAACQSSCNVSFMGGFAGADPLRLGVTYYTSDNRVNGPSIVGAAAFTGVWNGGAQSYTTVSDRRFFATSGLNAALNPVGVSGGQSSYDVDAAGRVIGLTAANGLTDRIGAATIAESGATSGNLLSWTRWSGGVLDIRRNGPGQLALSPSQGYQIITGAPLTNLPTTGTFTYNLVGGTRPTEVTGALAPGSIVTGSAVVAFGSLVRIGFDLNTSIGNNTYNLFTTGRTTDVMQSEIAINANSSYYFAQILNYGNVTANGGACAVANACRPIFSGFLAGNGATGLGLDYRVQSRDGAIDFNGVAAFTQGAAVTPPVSNGVVRNLTAAPTTAGIITMQSSGQDVRSGAITNGGISFNAATGAVTTLNNGVKRIGNTSVTTSDQGSVANAIGWARWTQGQIATNPGQATYQGNQGAGFIWGAVATNVPTTGTATYTVIGSTTPTTFSSTAVNTFAVTGSLAVDFASRRAGFDTNFTVNDRVFNFASTGGVTAPSIGLNDNWAWSNVAADPTRGATGTSNGFLAGPGGAYAGISYNISQPNGSDAYYGVIAFGRPTP